MELGQEEVRQHFIDFLESYRADGYDVPLYVTSLEMMATMAQKTLLVDFAHVVSFDGELAETIQAHFYKLEPALKKALHAFVKAHAAELTTNGSDQKEQELWLRFFNIGAVDPMRELRAESLGRLAAFNGTVTRTSEVRPELFLGTFKCNECGQHVENVEQQFKYTQPLICSNTTCGNRQNWELVREESEFVDWQRVKVQEATDEVPAGSLPRTLDVILRQGLVETVRPGDKVEFVGSLIVVPDVAAIGTPGERVTAAMTRSGGGGKSEGITGMKFLGTRELSYKLAFLANSTQTADVGSGVINIRENDGATTEDLYAYMDDEQKKQMATMRADPNLYSHLASSLAPGVYGHEDVKKAVLLMLLGGVHKETRGGIHLRGDINLAIVGDPSCAKSQILKYVANFLPRAVYTSGKSSSAAGLTASVVKEPDSNEFCIEAGALMLADTGICCIDEFDKMDVKDQVAIHEAMEQQTISIAKAGIQATLNARTSILAAANPIGGRYDKSKPLRHNVGLSPAILSRFDLLHIMVDEPDPYLDRKLAEHIVRVHTRGDVGYQPKYNMQQIQLYIRVARSIVPKITQEAKATLVEGYKLLRSEDAGSSSESCYRITVRQLEALVRLSEALARLRCSGEIKAQYVQEAVRLVSSSIISIEEPDAEIGDWDVSDGMEEELRGAVERFQRQQAEEAGAPMEADEQQGSDPVDQPAGEPADQPAADVNAERARAQQGLEAVRGQGITEHEAQRGRARVSQQKVNYVKHMLVSKLRAVAEEEEGAVAAVAGQEVPIMSQQDLLTWYFDEQVKRGALTSNEAMKKELVLVSMIVQHLIRKEGVLIIVELPTRREGEEQRAFDQRQQKERLLAVHPNFNDE